MEQKLKEENKLIAEFMGYTVKGDTLIKKSFDDTEKIIHITEKNYKHWSSLMNVYFKLQNEMKDLYPFRMLSEIDCIQSYHNGIYNQNIDESFEAIIKGIKELNHVRTKNIVADLVNNGYKLE